MRPIGWLLKTGKIRSWEMKNKAHIKKDIAKKIKRPPVLAILAVFVVIVVLAAWIIRQRSGGPVDCGKRAKQFESIMSESASLARLVERYPGIKDFAMSLNNWDFNFYFANLNAIRDSSEFFDYLYNNPQVVESLAGARNPLAQATELYINFYNKNLFFDSPPQN